MLFLVFRWIYCFFFDGEKTYYEKIPFESKIKFFAMYPNFNLSTKKSRNVLPKQLDFKFAMSNIAASSFLVASIANNNLNNIKHSMKNVIHENFRKFNSKFLEIKNKALELNALGVYLSGAGPTIMAITSQDNLDFKNSMDSFLKA